MATCEKHTKERRGEFSELADLMETLDKSQASPGRHACAYCAYEKGIESGKKSPLVVASLLVVASFLSLVIGILVCYLFL